MKPTPILKIKKQRNAPPFPFPDTPFLTPPFSSSKKIADDIGEMLLKCGYQPSFYLQNSKGKEVEFKNETYTINHNVWIIRLKRSKFANVSNLEISKVKYNNFVYCVELEKIILYGLEEMVKLVLVGIVTVFIVPITKQTTKSLLKALKLLQANLIVLKKSKF